MPVLDTTFVLGRKFFYKLYKAEKDVNGEKDTAITYEQYRTMEKTMAEFIVNRIIEEQAVFTMPEALGTMMFKEGRAGMARYSRVQRERDTAYVKGARKRYLNTSTFGHYFVPHWIPGTAYIRNKTVYEFRFLKRVITRFNDFAAAVNKDPSLIIIRK